MLPELDGLTPRTSSLRCAHAVQAHADYVANQVSAFASLAGFDASRLKNLPKSTHPFAGPPSSTKLA